MAQSADIKDFLRNVTEEVQKIKREEREAARRGRTLSMDDEITGFSINPLKTRTSRATTPRGSVRQILAESLREQAQHALEDNDIIPNSPLSVNVTNSAILLASLGTTPVTGGGRSSDSEKSSDRIFDHNQLLHFGENLSQQHICISYCRHAKVTNSTLVLV